MFKQEINVGSKRNTLEILYITIYRDSKFAQQ